MQKFRSGIAPNGGMCIIESSASYNSIPCKGNLISPTNSLIFPKTEECSEVKQNFTSVTSLFHCIFAIHIQKKQKFQQFLLENIIILGN